MDWRSVTFDWNRARAFLVTAEEGSLSAAARALNMTQPTLGRQVSALEQELGIALFERVGKGLELTPSGLELIDHVRAMGEAANRLSLTASGQSTSIEGDICITATEAMAAFILPSIIYKLRQQQPGINIELIASNSTSDLQRREADIALRAFRPSQPDLIAKKLLDLRHYLYCSSSYLERLGQVNYPENLNQADFIGFSNIELIINAFTDFGLTLTRKNFPVITDNHIVQWQLVREGIGIGIMSDDIGDHDTLVQKVLPDLEPLKSEIWLVAHRELRTNLRVRMVFDFLDHELTQFKNDWSANH